MVELTSHFYQKPMKQTSSLFKEENIKSSQKSEEMQYVFLKLHCIKINDKCVTNQGKKTRHTHQLVKMSERKKSC